MTSTVLLLCAKRTCQNFSKFSLFIFGSGWLFKLELKSVDELKVLMNEEAYQAFLKSQSTEEH